MARWENWSGRLSARPQALSFVRSESDAAALIRACGRSKTPVRVAGAGHSHAPVVINDGVIVDTSGLSGVLDVDSTLKQAWIRAGSPVYSLGGALHEYGLALKNQGDIDRQLLAGAVSTGTHGTGKHLQNMAASVVGLQILLASGELVECNPDLESALFNVARLSIGSVGLITRIKMQLNSNQVLAEAGWDVPFATLIDEIPALIEGHERFEFFWYPGTDMATVKTINPIDEDPVYPLAEEGQKQAFSYEVLPSHRPHRHTEMEYSIPAESGPACFTELRQMLRTDFPEISWPVEYRTVASDDIWLSMASGRPTVTLSVHQDIREPDEPYFRACEEIFLRYDGRPHWGKVNYLNGTQLAALYPHWDDWWRVRNQYDPDGIFLNSYARNLRD